MMVGGHLAHMNRTTIIHMATSVLTLNKVCIMLKIRALYSTVVRPVICEGDTLFTSFTPPLFIEVRVPNQESEQSCMCAWGIAFAYWYDFSFGFWNFSDRMVFLFYILLQRDLPVSIAQSNPL